MENEYIYIVQGFKRHFTGDTETTIVGARKEEREAILLGDGWAKSQNEWFHEQNQNIHAFYLIRKTYLR